MEGVYAISMVALLALYGKVKGNTHKAKKNIVRGFFGSYSGWINLLMTISYTLGWLPICWDFSPAVVALTLIFPYMILYG